MLITGAGQVVTDSLARMGCISAWGPLEADAIFNLAAALAWTLYLAFRVLTVPGQIQAWGFRSDHLKHGTYLNGIFLACAVPLILLLGLLLRRYPQPAGFWIALAIYPIWGIAQQFALQNLVRHNLSRWIPGAWPRIILTASLFSAAHTPDFPLMILTWIAGIAFSWIYEKAPNIWPLGLAHGVLGTRAYYIILGRNPLAF